MISPHYYHLGAHRWRFGGQLEKLMDRIPSAGARALIVCRWTGLARRQAPTCGWCRTLLTAGGAPLSTKPITVTDASFGADVEPFESARAGGRLGALWCGPALRSIPTLLVIKDGREIDRIVGLMPKTEIACRLERALTG